MPVPLVAVIGAAALAGYSAKTAEQIIIHKIQKKKYKKIKKEMKAFEAAKDQMTEQLSLDLE